MDSVATMTRTTKRTLIVVGVILVSVSAVLGTCAWWYTGMWQPVIWETRDGGLRVLHVPFKGWISLSVTKDYREGSAREWVNIDPGATKRFILAAPARDPEELLLQAYWIRVDQSDFAGLCRFYSEASRLQRWKILGILENADSLSDEILECLKHLLELPGEDADDESTKRIRELVSTTRDQ